MLRYPRLQGDHAIDRVAIQRLALLTIDAPDTSRRAMARTAAFNARATDDIGVSPDAAGLHTTSKPSLKRRDVRNPHHAGNSRIREPLGAKFSRLPLLLSRVDRIVHLDPDPLHAGHRSRPSPRTPSPPHGWQSPGSTAGSCGSRCAMRAAFARCRRIISAYLVGR
jgi:hypothetical protein